MKKEAVRRLAICPAVALTLFSTVSVSAAVTPQLEITYENNMENARLSVTDEGGNVILDNTYSASLTQLSHYTLLKGTGKYFYFVHNGMVSAYDNATGELAWTNYELNGSPCENCFAVDADDTLYVSGYYGPDLFVVDADGNTITNCSLEKESYWPYQMTLLEDGTLDITYEMDEITENFDPKAYEGCIDAADNSFSGGQTMTVCKCQENISLRSVPNSDATVITTIPLGAEVTYIRNSTNGFYEIEYNGMDGYSLAEYLQ